MHIDHNSYGSVALAYIIGAVAIILFRLLFRSPWLFWPLTVLVLMILVWQTMFFRVPQREKAGSGHIVTAVADGRIVINEKVFEPEFLQRDCIQVSIYMDFFDVHANFWPVTGEVTYCQYHPGKHKLAFLPKSSDLNEHATTAIRTPEGKELLFKQIAGTFARRVVSYSKPGLQVRAGEQCGIIKLGSRIDFFLPIDADIKVDEGDIVRACETVIAEL